MTIGIDIRSLVSTPRTGVGEYTFGLLGALFALDAQNTYILFSNTAKGKAVQPWQQSNVRYVATRYPNKLFHRSVLHVGWPKLDTLLGREIDVFFSPNIGFTALSKRCKQILTVHDLSFELMPETFSLKRRLWHWELNPRKQCERADMILVPSENTKRDVVEVYGISPHKVQVVYPGIERRTPTEEEKTAVKKKYRLPETFFLFLGTIEPRKNVDALLAALAHTKSTTPLVVAGAPGWLCKKTLAAITAHPRVQHIGYVDAADKPTLYTLAHVFVYPSLYEGFGFPPLEAMAAGTPVITSNRSALPEVCRAAAYYVHPYDPMEIAHAIDEVESDEALRARLTREGVQNMVAFSWDRAARQLLDFCVQLS